MVQTTNPLDPTRSYNKTILNNMTNEKQKNTASIKQFTNYSLSSIFSQFILLLITISISVLTARTLQADGFLGDILGYGYT